MIINNVYRADLHIRNLQKTQGDTISIQKILKQVKEDKIEDSVIYIGGDIVRSTKAEVSPELVRKYLGS